MSNELVFTPDDLVFTPADTVSGGVDTSRPTSFQESMRVLAQSPDWKAATPGEKFKMTRQMEEAYYGVAKRETPEYAEKYPNIYGAIGAAKAVGAAGTEILGQTAGELLGGAAGSVPGKVAGGAVGYASARKLNRAIGLSDDESDYAKDLGLGAVYSALPMVGGAVIQRLAPYVPKNRATAILKDAYERANKPMFRENERATADVVSATGITPSLGQAANAPELLAKEQSTRHMPGGLQAAEEMRAANEAKLQEKLSAIPGQSADLVNAAAAQEAAATRTTGGLPRTDAMSQGEKILAANEAAAAASKAAVSAKYAEVPTYEVPLPSFSKDAEALSSLPLAKDTADVVNSFLGHLNSIRSKGVTDFNATEAIDKSLTSYIKKNKDPHATSLLAELQRKLRGDLQGVDAALEDGTALLHGGKIYSKSAVQAELDSIPSKLAKLDTEVSQAAGRLESANIQPQKAALERRAAELEQVLAEGTAGSEIGKKYAAARAAHKQHMDTYGRTTYVGDILDKEYGRTVMDLEKMPSAFRTQTGAKQLIASIGKEKASAMMGEHFGSELASKIDSGASSQALTKWLVENRHVLKAYGVENEMATAVKAVRNKEILQKITGANPATLWESIQGTPAQRVAQAQRIMNMVRGNSAATAGAQKAYVEMVRNKMTTSKELRSGEFGLQDISQILEEQAPIRNIVFANNPQGAKDIMAVSDALRILNRRATGQISENVASKNRIVRFLVDAVGGAVGAAGGQLVAGHPGSMIGFAGGAYMGEKALFAYREAVNDYLIKAANDANYARELIRAAAGNQKSIDNVKRVIQRVGTASEIAGAGEYERRTGQKKLNVKHLTTAVEANPNMTVGEFLSTHGGE